MINKAELEEYAVEEWEQQRAALVLQIDEYTERRDNLLRTNPTSVFLAGVEQDLDNFKVALKCFDMIQ